MTKGVLIALAAAVALTGCTNGRLVLQGSESNGSRIIARPLATNPVVHVDGTGADAILVVDQEPIRIKVKEHPPHSGTFLPVTILFELATAGYKFAPESLTNNPLKIVSAKGSTLPGPAVCQFPNADETKLSCTYTPLTKNRVFFSYTLRVKDSSGAFVSSDPTVMND